MTPEREFHHSIPSSEAKIDFEKHSHAVFLMLPERVREDHIGQSIRSIQTKLAEENLSMDLVYFNGFVERLATYIGELWDNESEQEYPERKFIVAGVVNEGKGALVVSPLAFNFSDIVVTDNFAQYLMEHVVPAGHKIIRKDLSEQAQKIIEDVMRTKAQHDAYLSHEVFGDDLTVHNMEKNKSSTLRYVQFSEDYMKNILG